MTWLFAAPALAAPGTERGAWPSLPLEQPVVLSRGWALLSASAVREERLRAGFGVDGWVGGAGDLRYGVAEGVELGVATRVVVDPAGGPVRLDAPALTGRFALAGREGPTASAGVIASLVPPWPGAAPALTGGVAAAVVTAPVRWSGEAGLTWCPPVAERDAPERLWARGQALLQLGPLAGVTGLSLAVDGPARPLGGFAHGGVEAFGTLGAQLNASRGLAAWVAFQGSLARSGPAVAVAGRSLEAGVRVAW